MLLLLSDRKLHDAEVELAQAGKAARDYALRKALQPVEEAWKPSWLKRQLLQLCFQKSKVRRLKLLKQQLQPQSSLLHKRKQHWNKQKHP